MKMSHYASFVPIFCLLALHCVISINSCDIPVEIQGRFFSNDRRPQYEATVNSTFISLTSYTDETLVVETGTQYYECLSVNATYHNEDRLHGVNVWMRNVQSQKFKCYNITLLVDNGNALRWRESIEFAEEEHLVAACSDSNNYRIHNPRNTDGDYVYKWDLEPLSCRQPFNETLQYSYKEPTVLSQSEKPSCESSANQMVPLATGELQINWVPCPNISGVIMVQSNFSLYCRGSWPSHGGRVYLMEHRGYTTQLNKYTCVWVESTDQFSLRLAMSLDDCSMLPRLRRYSVQFDLLSVTDGGSAVGSGWLSTVLLPLLMLACVY